MDDEIYVRQYAIALLEVADQEYIAARLLYKNDFWEPYLTLGQQVIEKYLKVILLFNGINTTNFNHDLERLFKAVEAIDEVEDFLSVLEEENFSYLSLKRDLESFAGAEHVKYAVISYSFQGKSLISLDHFVFIFRRFCDLPRRYPRKKLMSFKLFNGYLEKVLKNKANKYSSHYKALIWNNPYWGKRKKVGYYKEFSKSKNTILHVFNTEKCYLALSELVKLPLGWKKYIEFLKSKK